MIHSVAQAERRLGGREEVRRRIQEAALACFCAKGLAGATMADIARSAGLSSAAIYLHFAGKRALFESLNRPDLNVPAARVRERRQTILDAALRVFSDQGYAGATMDDVAAAAGLSKAALYGHFDSKESLFVGVLRAAPSIDGALRVGCPCPAGFAMPDGAATPSLREFLTALALGFFASNRDQHRYELLRIIFAEGVRHPEVAAMLRRMIDEGAKQIAEQLSALGLLSKSSHQRELAGAFMGLLFAWALVNRLLAKPPGERQSTESAVAEEKLVANNIVTLFLEGAHGLGAPRPRGDKKHNPASRRVPRKQA
jgi:AcrR family transcriptional regulator